MKLLNQTILYLSAALFFILSAWGVAFYYNMMGEVYDSLDDGLANYKMLIIRKAMEDSALLSKHDFAESNYRIQPVGERFALSATELYKDSIMFMESERDFEPVRLLTTYFKAQDENFYELKVIQSMVEEDKLILSLTYSIIVLFLLVIISMFFINKFILRSIWLPFYKLQQELRNFKLGTTSTFNVPRTAVLEFASLNKAISDLLYDNMQIFDKQKNFIDNAAHELQTPLAISRNKLELLLDRFQHDEQTIQQLYEILQQLERMTKMNKTLLLLTKIENKQFDSANEVDFIQLWRNNVEEFSDMISYHAIEVIIKDEIPCKRNFNMDLANMLISNLLKNAIVHNIPQGKIIIEFFENGFAVANTGKSTPLSQSRIFSRFYKESDHANSTGLGLSIVRSIMTMSEGQISYTFTDEGLHEFHVFFK